MNITYVFYLLYILSRYIRYHLIANSFSKAIPSIIYLVPVYSEILRTTRVLGEALRPREPYEVVYTCTSRRKFSCLDECQSSLCESFATAPLSVFLSISIRWFGNGPKSGIRLVVTDVILKSGFEEEYPRSKTRKLYLKKYSPQT